MTTEIETIVALAAVTIGYVAYHYAPLPLFQKRIFGSLVLGVAPVAILILVFDKTIPDIGLALPDPAKTFLAGIGIFALVLPTTILASRRPKMWEFYPPLRVDNWTRELHTKNALTWTIYLFGYELCFRGFFLFAMVRFVGPNAAVAITTLAYVFAHLPKNAGETIGTIPMGIVFAIAALWTGGFWAAFIAHVLIALSSDFLMVRARQRATRAASAGDNL